MNEHQWKARGAAALIATSLVLLGCQLARGASPCPDGEPTKVEAPCVGWALSEADALFFAGLKVELKDCRSQAKEAAAVAAAQLESKDTEVEAAKTRIAKLETALDDALEIQVQPASVPWHEHPAFVAITSTVVVGAVTALAVVLAYEVD